MARVAEQAERHEDMVEFLKKVLDQKGGDINADERNLVSVAFKNLIQSKRAAVRTISAIEQNPQYAKFAEALAGYKQRVQDLLYADCENIVEIVKTKVIAKPVEGEAKAFFAKMVGDYWRYVAESATGAKLEQAKSGASEGYALALSDSSLPACNPTKLGLALNYSVFQYEVLQNPKEAIETADQALQAALEKIDEL